MPLVDKPFALVLSALLLASCAAQETAPEPEAPQAPMQPVAQDSLQRTFDRIARLEDQRSDGGGDLQRLASSSNPKVRIRALRALGRLPFPEHGARVTEALIVALGDPQAETRAEAAFGLGLRADPASGKALLAAWSDPDPLVRARLVEAGGRFEDLVVREEVMYALSDPSPLVRAEAATAPHTWDPTSRAAAVVDAALANLAARAPAELRRERWKLPDGTNLSEGVEDPEVIWRALFSLARRRAERGRLVFYLWCRAPGAVTARIFATRGIARLENKTGECMEALRECLTDEDWRVVVEAAAGLGRFPEPASLVALERVLGHPSTQVRIAAADALGHFTGQRATAHPILEKLLVDGSPNVRAMAIISFARLFSDGVAADLEVRALDGDARIRKAVAESGEFLASALAMPLLIRLTRDEDPAVAFAAVVGLGNHLELGGRERAHELLRSADNGLRLAAVQALAFGPTRADLQPLLACFTSSEGDIAGEIRYEILGAAAQVQDDRAFEILVNGLRAERPYTREVARKLLAEHYPDTRVPTTGDTPPRRGEVPSIDPNASNPLVEITTARGTMVFELFPAEAPIHVFNFLSLAQQGTYDGLDFHRVALDFVVQGGDPRGDGNGGLTWRGEPLRSEFGPRKYVRGSLGMPRNADPDSGGGQFFVTHRPTPHLDGRYTIFGQLRQGSEVLDSLEIGDRIVGVQIRGAARNL